jgi:hypothetical protein
VVTTSEPDPQQTDKVARPDLEKRGLGVNSPRPTEPLPDDQVIDFLGGTPTAPPPQPVSAEPPQSDSTTTSDS